MKQMGRRAFKMIEAGGAGGIRTAWGNLTTDSGPDDGYQNITLYRSAKPATFTEATCGLSPFMDMQHTLCDEIGSTFALVPAGYKAGEVMLIKFPDCDPGTDTGDPVDAQQAWEGWVVVAGPTMRCAQTVPVEIECCPLTQTLQFTLWNNFWYFGAALPDTETPCEV